ncbi:MAG: hypothetical protein MJY67_03415 [Bacteroidales bacterium]|nr:hypothetical protein [Bacteroidales bacterium]
MVQKKKAVVSYEKMSEDLAALFNEKYPRGLMDYFQDIKILPKPDGTQLHVVEFDTEDATYMVKVKAPVDDIEDVTKWMDEGGDDESDEEGGDTLPDDNISQYEESSDE